MRRSSSRLSLLLALAAACERDDFAPALPGLPAPPDPIPARCGDGIENDPQVCLESFTVGLPFAHEFIRFADFDGDGARDFFAINTAFEVSWALFFTGGVESGGPKPLVSYEFLNYDFYRPEVLDFDGDGRTDLASAVLFSYFVGDHQTASRQVIAWLNRGDYQFERVNDGYGEFPPTLAPGDIDGDGRTDLLTMGYRTVATVWAYVPATDDVATVLKVDLKPLQIVGDPLVAAADFNGDKHADFALMDGDGRAWQLLGGPDHQLTIRQLQSAVVVTPGSRTLYAHDLDGDGLDDLIAVRFSLPTKNPPPPTISIALATPDGGFTPLASFDAAHTITDACVEFCNDSVVAHIHLGFLDLDGSGQPASSMPTTSGPSSSFIRTSPRPSARPPKPSPSPSPPTASSSTTSRATASTPSTSPSPTPSRSSPPRSTPTAASGPILWSATPPTREPHAASARRRRPSRASVAARAQATYRASPAPT